MLSLFNHSYACAEVEQPGYRGDQSILRKNLMSEFAHLKLEGVSTQSGYIRDAVKKATSVFLEHRELEKLKPETIAYIAKKCADHGVSFEAVVAENRAAKSIFQSPYQIPGYGPSSSKAS